MKSKPSSISSHNVGKLLYFIFWHPCLRNKLHATRRWKLFMAIYYCIHKGTPFKLFVPKIYFFFFLSCHQNVCFALTKNPKHKKPPNHPADLPPGQKKEPDTGFFQQGAALHKISTAVHTYTDSYFAILLCFTLMKNCHLVLNCIGFCFKPVMSKL